MYVPIIKNQDAELRALSKLSNANIITDNIIPLIEVVKKETKCDPKIDPATGKIMKQSATYSTGRPYQKTVLDPDTKRDITLQNIASLLPNHPVFVDFFRCDMRKYKKASPNKYPLVIELNNNLEEYKKRVKSITNFPNLIPVITIKNGVDNLSVQEFIELAECLKNADHHPSIAIRIDDVENYATAIKQVLREEDYLLFDINEAPHTSKTMELDDLADIDTPARKILLCSPRKRDITNGKFGENYEIDNSHLAVFHQYGCTGVGDYAGFCDRLGSDGGSNIGCALAIFYQGETNSFEYFVNHDVNCGTRGYREVVENILRKRNILEKYPGECMVLQEIATQDKHGNWSTWITYTIMRYIQQLYLTYNNYDIQ